MTDLSMISPDMAVVGADGIHLGTVDHLDGALIKLTSANSAQIAGQGGKHHSFSRIRVSAVEANKVWLSANVDAAFDLFEEEE